MAAFDFPNSPNTGDTYSANGVTFSWNGSVWTRFSASSGAQGSTGPTGAQGAVGSTGAQGATGSGGSTGAQGAAGAQGATGPTGAQGAQGVAGSSTTINSNTNDYLITGTGTANTLQGEANLQFDGTNLFMPNELRHLGDPDTKIGFDTNIIKLETAGSERLRINSDGKLNYHSGTIVGGTLPYAFFNIPTSSYGGVDLTMNLHDPASEATGKGGGLGFSAVGSSGNPVVRAAIRGNTEATTSEAGYLTLHTRTNGGGNDERLRITSEGKVGINETSPSNQLHIAGTTSTSAGGLLRLDCTTGDNFILYDNTHDSTEWAVGNDSSTRSNFDVWYNDGSSYDLRTRIDANGYFSIGGTSSVSTLLHVENGSGDAYIRCRASVNKAVLFNNNDGSAQGFIGSGGTNGGAGADLAVQSNSGNIVLHTPNGGVRMPNQICFQAVVNSGSSASFPSSNTYLVFGSVDINVGNAYNSSTGIFTAPVAGNYLFHISAIAHNNTATVFRYFLYINNAKTGSGNDAHLRLDRANNGAAAAYAPNASYTYYKYMNVNDTARVYFTPDDNSAQTYGPADYFKFAGHLVG